MKGALVFLAVFFIGVFVTISSPAIPPGMSIYYALGFPDNTYPILGIAAPTFGAAIFNGIIYGVIVWLIYSIIVWGTKSKKKNWEDFSRRMDRFLQ